MALKCFLQRSNDVDLTEAHVELQRFDLRIPDKRALVSWYVWLDRDTAEAGEAHLYEINKWWNISDLAAVHTLIKNTTAKGLRVLVAALEEHAKDVDTDESGDFSPTFGAISDVDVKPLV